jgi:hypothetical protein
MQLKTSDISIHRPELTLSCGQSGTPPHADIYGYVYNIDTGALTQVVNGVRSSRRPRGC